MTLSVLLAGCQGAQLPRSSPRTTEGPAGEQCVGFPGEQVNAIAWAPDGLSLSVASDLLSDGTTVIRRIEWPTLERVEVVRGTEYRNRDVGAGPAGAVSWIRDEDANAVVEEVGPAIGDRTLLVRLQTAVVTNLVHLDDGVAILGEVDGDAAVITFHSDGGRDTIFRTGQIIDSFGMSHDGQLVAAHHYPEVGEPGALTTVTRATEQSYPVAGTGIARLTMTGDGQLLFIEVATGSLVLSDAMFENHRVLRRSATSGALSSLRPER